MLKIYLRRFHLYLAIVSAFFLVNLSLSGAILLFAKDIQALISPEHWLIPSDYSQQQPLALSQLVKKLELTTNKQVKIIEQAEYPTQAWSVVLANNSFLNINPYNGEILLEHRFYDTLYGFTMAWHRWLLYVTNAKERPLQVIVSCASLILIVEILLGCYLWLKPKNRLKRLKVKWRSKRKTRYYQLHGTLGTLCCIPLILIAFSGMAFHWQAQTKQIIEWLSMSEVTSPNFTHQAITKQPAYQLDKAFNNAHAALKASKVYRIYLPQKPNEPLKLRLKMPQESHANSWSWANPYTGEVLGQFDASQTSSATQIWHFKYKFHIGEFIHWSVKWLWLLLSLLPSFFVITGIYLFLKRR